MVRIFRQRRVLISIPIIVITIALLLLSVLRVQAATFTLLVDTVADNTVVDGTCSLREAILVANSGIAGIDCAFVGGPADLVNDDFEIRFDTGGTIPAQATIELLSELPAITSTVDIRGFNIAYDATHRVTITPDAGATIARGLRFEQNSGLANVNSDNSGVFNLIIDGFGFGLQINDVAGVQVGRDGVITAGLRNYFINNAYGIDILGDEADGTVISNNSIGLDEANAPAGNTFDGIRVRQDALNTLIGGTGNVAFGNVISSNGRYGLSVTNADTIDISNNVIGLVSSTLATDVGNGSTGIYILQTEKVTIERNIIGFNVGGIQVNDSINTLLTFNLVGVNNTPSNVGNAGIGILIRDSDGSRIRGGPGVGQETIVANNGSTGIAIVRSQRVEIDNTLTFDNNGLGIDLDNNGVTPNDVGDGDAGANASLNYPVLASAATDGATLIMNGALPTGTGTYEMVFYVNTTCDPSGFGEGQAFLQNAGNPYTLTTATGQFSATLNGAYNVGDFVTVFAVSQNAGTLGNTSEFSQCFAITDNTLTATFVPSATTILTGQSIFFDNTSMGLITDTRWFVNGAQVSTAYDLTRIFATAGTFSVELEVEDNFGAIVRSAPRVITVLAPTPIPPTSVPPTSIPPSTAISSNTPIVVVAVNTETPIPTNTPLPSATLVPSATATTIPSRTPIPTSTLIPSVTASSTLLPSPTATETLIATLTATPALEVTVEGDGENIMSVMVVNSGISDANNVIVQEQLRDGVEYRSSSLGDPICTEVGGLVSCRLGGIGAGQSANVDFTLQTNGESPDSGITTVFADGVIPQIIDEPYIIKVGNPPVAPPGTEITYTIRVINPTSESAFDMVIEDNMPDIIEILDASATTGDLEITGQNIQLSLDELGAGERVTLTIQALVREDEEAVEAIINEACVTSSSNPSANCAIMSFLAVGILPNTGQVSLYSLIIRWGVVLGFSILMLVGIALFYLRLKATE